jgi:SAM-dependent methyltransferase
MMEHLQEGLRSGIEDQLRERFRKAAQSPRGLFQYPTGREGLLALAYPEEALRFLPESVQEYYCGVGNPFAAGLPSLGDQVLDVGCGAGVDALVAAHQVGPEGRVAGLEFSPDMRDRAQANAALAGLGNAAFLLGGAEALPFADASFDLLLSNGVFNLVLRKRQALAEAHRVLRPGGRLQIADQILEDETPLQVGLAQPTSWAA